MGNFYIFLIISGVLAASLFICDIFAKKYNLDSKDLEPNQLTSKLWMAVMIFVILLCAIGSALIINILKWEYNAFNGLIIGFGASIIGLVFDFLMLISYKNGLPVWTKYLRHPLYWITYLLIIITCTLIGMVGNYFN